MSLSAVLVFSVAVFAEEEGYYSDSNYSDEAEDDDDHYHCNNHSRWCN